MSGYQALTVYNRTGGIVLDVDANGVRDSTARQAMFIMSLPERLTATPLAAYSWTCIEGVWQIVGVNAKLSVTGGASNAVDVLYCSQLTAPASGTTQLTATISLVGTAPFQNYGTLIASPNLIFPGDSISRNISGTVGSVEGILTINVKRVS